MKYEVYKIQNKVNNKVYIGITNKGYNNRFRKHLSEARNGSTFILHLAINKYGKDNFFVTLLETCSSLEVLKEREKFWIKTLNSTNRDFGYNMTEGGDGTFGRFHSEETKKKIGERLRVGVSIENTDTKEIKLFESTAKACKYLNKCRSYLSDLRRRNNYSTILFDDNLIIKYIEKEKPKPKKNQDISAHMKMMQEKSIESRSLNKEEFSKKQKEVKKDKTKIVCQFDLQGNLIKEYNGCREAATYLNKSRSAIQHCLKGRNKTAYGFVWKFKE